MMKQRRLLYPKLALMPLLALVVLVYLPGLHGGFLFDDYGNLPILGAQGPIDNLPAFWRYITSGIADPTGRPVALLSFLADAHDWPADPFPFKRTSLLLHMLNGLLLFSLLRSLGEAWLRRICLIGGSRETLGLRAQWAALLAAAIWLLHPLFVSTTLYVVQREAMLPVTFVLAGLLAWLHGRVQCSKGNWRLGMLWCLAGLGGGTVLAVLSKANGVLLPLLALLVERIALEPWRVVDEAPPPLARSSEFAYKLVLALAMWFPTVIIIAWLMYQGVPDILTGNTHGRPWTIGQRILTQPRVLADYLRLLWLPHPYTSGLFNDQISASRSLFVPVTTAPAMLLVLGLLGGSWYARKRWPPLAFAILFYFGAQLIESTVLPLELYFEHRNYLPAIALFWPLALWICGVPQSLPLAEGEAHKIRVAPRIIASLLLIAILATMTLARADLWGNTSQQALVWARLNPASPRAQANAAQIQLANGHPELVVQSLQAALARAPAEVQLALNLVGAECTLGGVSPSTFAAAEHALALTGDPGSLLTHWFERAIVNARAPACPQADYGHLKLLLGALASNQALMERPGRRQDLAYLQGNLALAQDQGKAALSDFNNAIDQQVRIEAALKQAALLGLAGYPELGLAHLSHYEAKKRSAGEFLPPFGMPRIHAWVLRRQGYWDRELNRLRATLREDARHKQMRNE
jgi:hypothetical protein